MGSISSLALICLVLWLGGSCCEALSASSSPTTTSSHRSTLWNILETSDGVAQAFSTIFGMNGERGEYMDGYSPEAMLERCLDDYLWTAAVDEDTNTCQRAVMMSHLYRNTELYKYTTMIAFAEHYIFGHPTKPELLLTLPYQAFQKFQQKQASTENPIFAGVVWNSWRDSSADTRTEILEKYKSLGVDYVRLECNFGTAEEIGPPSNLASSKLLPQLCKCIKLCQRKQLLPIVLIQVPWRHERSKSYYDTVLLYLARSLQEQSVETCKLILETRPPMGDLSAQEEASLSSDERIQLGAEIGTQMFETISLCFPNQIAGFCVAGGSTKGQNPPAMQDDTQNAVRQGIRSSASEKWKYPLCYWEMGAKLMLQPEVGQLFGTAEMKTDEAKELFASNAKALAYEISQTPLKKDVGR